MIERSPRETACGRRHRAAAAIAAVGLALVGSSALAHGPTVRVSYGRVVPATLTITAGQVVHFVNANAAANPVTIAAEDGSFESPTLARGEGWHRAFEKPGRFTYRVAEFSSAGGAIIVAEP